jgi:hypothetical protein
MPIKYERDDARRRVVVTVQGPFAVADFLAVMERQRGDNAGAYGILYDLRDMTGAPSLADLGQAMNQAAQTHRLRGPIAILATDPVYGGARAYAALGHPTLTVQVFRDRDKADEWPTAQAKTTQAGEA